MEEYEPIYSEPQPHYRQGIQGDDLREVQFEMQELDAPG
tara:strand:+ start:4571 stop:4687 length:117 start_codon:yes stop_codon:yes gene_type:complete